MTTWEMRSNQKPKRCTAQYPFTGTFQNGHRCTLEVGHTGPHTILPPSGMDYAQDDDPRVTMDDGVSYCDRHHRFDCPDCAEIAALREGLREAQSAILFAHYYVVEDAREPGRLFWEGHPAVKAAMQGKP